MRALGIENISYLQGLGVTKVNSRASHNLCHLGFRMLNITSIRDVTKKI